MAVTRFLEIKTYGELGKYVSAFSNKHMGLVIIVSRAGLGKSTMVERALEIEDPLLLNSHITPLRFYEVLYEKTQEDKDCLVIIDEAEMMFQNAKLKTMLKILCDTRTEKVLQYTSSTSIMKDVPQQFETNAKVILLINNMSPADEHIRSIMSRGHCLFFNPSDMEILTYMKSWADDKEIISFIQDFARHSKSLNLRTYVKAKESKKSDLDWQKEVIRELDLDNRFLLIRQLHKNFSTEVRRVAEWERLTSESRANYFRYKKLYLKK